MPLQPEADLKDEPHALKDADDNSVVIFGSLINMRFREETGENHSATSPACHALTSRCNLKTCPRT
jgi:hypothetical protein